MSHAERQMRGASHVRIAFPLARDEDGYPPADWEHLWARALDDERFVIDNTPFFVMSISFGDIVSVARVDGDLVYRALLSASSHSTIRVVLYETSMLQDLRRQLRELGCLSEVSHLPNLLAVDVPGNVSLPRVRTILDEGESGGFWEYEEASVRQ